MWKKGFSETLGFFYWILKCDSITASRLYSAMCSYLGPVSLTQCLNGKVNWLDNDYDFIIWGKDEKLVDKAKIKAESLQ